MIAKLYIQAALRYDKTRLKSSFYTQPFKLADITEDKKDATLHLMLMSSSPGILDNDDYKIKIELDEQCSVRLQTQSYQRLFQMKTGARQEMEVTMKKGSSFIFLPHPSVPHESSIFSAKNTFFLSEDCFLIWGEVLTCGRKLNGEVFRFSKYHSQTKIYFSDKLVIKENLLLEPATIDINTIGQLEGYTHQASFICINPDPSSKSVLEDIYGLLLEEKDICFGISTLAVSGFSVRLLGYKAELLRDILNSIAAHLLGLQRKKETINTAAYAK